MIKNISLLISMTAGIALGIVSTTVLFVASWLALIPWVVAGVAIGFLVKKKETFRCGGWYGFLLVLSFLFSGYLGGLTVHKLQSFIPFSFILAVIGAGWGIILAYGGQFLKRRFRKNHD